MRGVRQTFYQRQDARNTARLAEDPSYQINIRNYTGKPTFFDQIVTSLITTRMVATGNDGSQRGLYQ